MDHPVVGIELFRAYEFDPRDKSFLVPILRSDWLRLSAGGGHLSWCLWNSHTLGDRAMSAVSRQNINSYMQCSSHNCVVQSVFAGTALAPPIGHVMNNHEVGGATRCTVVIKLTQIKVKDVYSC